MQEYTYVFYKTWSKPSLRNRKNYQSRTHCLKGWLQVLVLVDARLAPNEFVTLFVNPYHKDLP
jgi:hypothetical protein